MTGGAEVRLPPHGLLALLQLTDSLSPVGGYAHSYGVEGLVQQGWLGDGDDLRRLLDGYIRHSLATADLAGVSLAHRDATAGQADRLIDLDAVFSALKVAREAREASVGIGRRLLENAALLAESQALNRYRALVGAGRCVGHHCIAFGVVAEALGVAEYPAAMGYGYVSVASVVSAALRLGLVGQREGQTILREQWPALEAAALRAQTIQPDQISAFAPGLEIALMRHERAYTRLFAS